MRHFRVIVAVLCMVVATGCGNSGVPEPIKVLENPATGERVRFFREISYKVPKDYNEAKHLADWTAEQNKAGFTKEIAPKDDREKLAELRRKNLEASKAKN